MNSTRYLKMHAIASTGLLVLLSIHALSEPAAQGTTVDERPPDATFEEITVKRVNVLDDSGRTRVTLAAGYPPRRAELSGLLFHNENGTEAGGLVYYGQRKEDGTVEAGAILTFDQFEEDQVLALEYAHRGSLKRNGIKIMDRPDEMSDKVKELYRALQAATSDLERDSIQKELLPKIPPEELPARRLYVGRTTQGASTVELCDGAGKPRIKLRVEKDGQASITFLDESGTAVRTIAP